MLNSIAADRQFVSYLIERIKNDGESEIVLGFHGDVRVRKASLLDQRSIWQNENRR